MEVFCLVSVGWNVEGNVVWNVLKGHCVLVMIFREGGKERSYFGWVGLRGWGIGW